MDQELQSLALLKKHLEFKVRPCSILSGDHSQAPKLLPASVPHRKIEVGKPNLDGQSDDQTIW